MSAFIAPDTSDPPFAIPADIVIDLPPPPSVNRTRRVNWNGNSGHRAWIKTADAMINGQKRRARNPLVLRKIVGAFEAHIILSRRHTRIDLDNGIKAIVDYARRIELIVDDGPAYLQRLVVEWGVVAEGCRLILREVEA